MNAYEEKKQTGYIHSVETGGMVDGPGIRYVLFFSGCVLRCKYCHNPDTWNLKGGRLHSVDEIINDILKYRSYLKFSGGGITVTGGEPLLQPEFLTALLEACKENNIHTAVDTSGYASVDAAARVLAHTDLLLLDIKTINPAVYKELTGVAIDRTLDMLKLSRQLNVSVWIRFVLVPGLTDNMEDIQKMSEFLKTFDNIKKIEVLPFHKLGEYKWENLGLPYDLKGVAPPSGELLNQVKGVLI